MFRSLICAIAFVSGFVVSAMAHEGSELDDADAPWMMSLKQPDAPSVSCCGPADHFYVDQYRESDTDSTGLVAFVKDKWIEVPGKKILWDKNNPTAHAVIFISTSGSVLCFVPKSGT